MTPKVQAFAKAFYAALDAGAWGCMEPQIFRNIAEGIDAANPDGFYADKMDQDEMASAVESMIAVLEKTL